MTEGPRLQFANVVEIREGIPRQKQRLKEGRWPITHTIPTTPISQPTVRAWYFWGYRLVSSAMESRDLLLWVISKGFERSHLDAAWG